MEGNAHGFEEVVFGVFCGLCVCVCVCVCVEMSFERFLCMCMDLK